MEGYDHLSSNMAQYSEFAIFRTFKILNYRALLFKQAELAEKEARLILAIKEDRNSGDPERQRTEGADAGDLSSPPRIQHVVFVDLLQTSPLLFGVAADFFPVAVVLEDDLLLQTRKLYDLPAVHQPSLACLREALMTPPGPHYFLHGRELRTWTKKKEYDLTSLTEQEGDRDLLSSALEWLLTKVIHKRFGQRRYNPEPLDEDWAAAAPTELVQYPRREIARGVTAVTTFLAGTLPTLSVSALFVIDNERARLGTIVLFSFLFSVALACVGVPRRIDSFVATATFTAVLIVFISNNTGCVC
ncbi:hypothetical protein CLAIMM_00564 [Cladophialophora immunda]|nr:hypothetical protein CLAIMM_00564 [Cladophialophora immunda]